MTKNAIKTEANRRDNSREFLTLKAYGYNLVLKDHKHCLQRKRALFSRLKEGETRSNTVWNKKAKEHVKKSMLFTEQGQQLGLRSFTRLGGRRREVSGWTGEERFNVYAWRGRGDGEHCWIKRWSYEWRKEGKKVHVITSSWTTEVYAVEIWNTILASLFFFFYNINIHVVSSISYSGILPLILLTSSICLSVQQRGSKIKWILERKEKRVIKVGWTERTEQEKDQMKNDWGRKGQM